MLRARDYTGTLRTMRRVVLYSELEIIQEHREQGEELCYTQRLEIRDYTGTRRTRRRVVLY